MTRAIMRNWKAFQDAPLTADDESDVTDLAFKDKGRAHIKWSGAAAFTATIDVQTSIDNVNWVSIMDDPIALDDGSGAGEHEIIFPTIDFSYMKFILASNAESAGTVSINMVSSSEGV